jgi:23S rRNA (uracil1939-C5)-methyltransferase
VTERLSISRLAHRGDGMAETASGPLYVAYTLPGETVEIERVPGHPDRGRLLRIDHPSPDRTAAICSHFGVCGGCAVQHWASDRYRAWKRDLVVTALTQAGVAAEVDELVDAHGEGRRRVVFHARRGTRDILQVGFAALRSHDVVAIEHCPILAPGLAGALAAAWSIAEALQSIGKPLDIQATATDAGMDVDVRGSGVLTAVQVADLAGVAEHHRLARLTRHGELVAQRAAPTLTMGRATVVLPPGAFLQATEAGETTLARLVAARVDKAGRIADLFAGVGPFALRLAERAHVVAADADAAAIAALKRAAATPGLKPIATQVRDLYRRPFAPAEFDSCDAVIFDPPRQGAEAQTRGLAASKVPMVVAVSCNPATFARDAKILVAGGYRLARVTPVDQFRYSAHVELVARFER